ncbi:MAG: hypothetical protein M3155_04350 [Actinomycetota bacterium]|nr:hypothetical protein [Actinomycetota bacterium]
MRSHLLRAALVALATTLLSAALASSAVAAGSATAPCRGSARLCTANFSLAGGASDKRLTVQLPGTSFVLLAANAKPAFVHGAYRLSAGRFSLGGSVYTVSLDAVEAIPPGSVLSLSFTKPGFGMKCGSNTNGVSFISIHVIGTTTTPGAFSCVRAHLVGALWAAAFRSHRSTRLVNVSGVSYACTLVPTLPQNLQCDGGGTRIKFSGPTG